MEFHDAANLFPMMSDSEFKQLVRDIKANGLQHSIVLFENKILDGRNRFSACLASKVEPKFVEWDGDDPYQFVVSMNVHRRHLTSDQRAAVAVELLPHFEAVANIRRLSALKQSAVRQNVDALSGDRNAGRSASTAARAMQTNRQYVSDLKAIRAESPDLFQNVKEGKLKRRAALTEVRHRRQLREVESAKGIVICQARPYKWEGALSLNSVYVADISRIELPAESVDMIFTDPPYGSDNLHLYDQLGQLAATCLKSHGSLMVYCGQRNLGEVIQRISKHLKYWWTCAINQAGTHERIYGLNVIATWKPIVWFVKHGRKNRDMIVDSITANRPEKNFHKWQQSDTEAFHYISRLTRADDLVIDPFCGGGTTVVTCAKLNRNFIAFDADWVAAQKTLDHLALARSQEVGSGSNLG